MIVVLALILLFGATPLLAVVAAAAVAGVLGCPLNESGAHACVVFGRDIGDALHVMFTSHWFAMMTVPVAAMVLVVWVIVALILLLLHRRRQRRRQVM